MTGLVPRPLVAVDGLTKAFAVRSALGGGRDGATALEDASFVLPRGGSLGIVGESGSGKTTLVRIVAGLLAPDGGRVLFDGVDVSAARGAELKRLRQQMQMVFQDPYTSLNPAFTVRRTLSEPLLVHGLVPRAEVPARVEELMAQVGLSAALAERRPRQLSGGQCQRVAIARALSVGPELLIADEAVSALDVSVQVQVLRLLARLRAELGLTLLFVSHQLATIAQICDEVVIMHRGRIVEAGPTEAVFADPGHAYTRKLLASHPSLEPRGGETG